MKRLNYKLNGGLEQDDLNEIHGEALRLIETAGIKVPNDEALAVLKGKKGVKIEEDRVLYDAALIEELTAGISCYPHYQYDLITGAYSHFYLDHLTGEIRQPVYDDLVYSVKLADALDMDVIAPVVPFDLPGNCLEMTMFKATCENGKKSYGGGQITTPESAEAIYEMSKVVNMPFCLEMWVISPLVMDRAQLDIIMKFRDRGPDIYTANMPMRGASAPIFIDTAYIQSVAECLASAATLRLISPLSRIYYRGDAFSVYPFDMREAIMPWCSPQYISLILIQNQIARFYGIDKPMAKSMLTMSRQPDEWACFEKGVGTMVFALNGARNFAAAGTLRGPDIFSPEQLLLDKEIYGTIMFFIKGEGFDIDPARLDIVREVGHGGSFLGHDTTLDNFHETIMPSRFFKSGLKPIRESVREALNNISLNEGSLLDAEAQREMDRIYDFYSKK